MKAVNEFHKQRVAFAIVDKKVLYLKDSDLSHVGWLVGGGIVTAEEFIHLTRGYYKDGVLAFYSGDFVGGALVERDIINYIDKIKEDLKIDDVKEIYCGVEEGELGQVWQPIKEIKMPKDCDSRTWNEMGPLEKVENAEDYLDAVWNNYVILNFRLMRDRHKCTRINSETLEYLQVLKGRLTNTWHEDEPVYLEKINNCLERLDSVVSVLQVLVED